MIGKTGENALKNVKEEKEMKRNVERPLTIPQVENKKKGVQVAGNNKPKRPLLSFYFALSRKTPPTAKKLG